MAHPRPYPPMSSAAWEARKTYLRQATARLSDPSAPEPDPVLLTVEPHGPFRSIRIAQDPDTGAPCIAFTVQNKDRKERFCPPAAFLVLDLQLAFGGGLSVNDTGTGLGYLKVFGGDDKLTFLRLLLDTKAGEVAKQQTAEGLRPDYHSHNPALLSKTTASEVAREGRPLRAPLSGREDAIGTALGYCRRHGWRAGFKASAEEYEEMLRAAYGLLDALHVKRKTPPEQEEF